MSKKAIVFKHLQQEGACIFGRMLAEIGWDVKTINVSRVGLADFDPYEPDLLIVMGGNIGVYQADDYPFLHEEVSIVKKRVEAQKPTMGICLGSQIMAKALGADVYKGSQGKEIGWYDLHACDDVEPDHPIHHICQPVTSMFHWHGDTFNLPKGARHLASSNHYVHQAYEYGDKAIALQCHPEVTQGRLSEWLVLFHDQISEQQEGKSVHDLRADTAAKIETLNKQGEKFLKAWLDKVGLGE